MVRLRPDDCSGTPASASRGGTCAGPNNNPLCRKILHISISERCDQARFVVFIGFWSTVRDLQQLVDGMAARAIPLRLGHSGCDPPDVTRRSTTYRGNAP